MKLISIIFLVFCFAFSQETTTYSWEDGGTILGYYGNLADPANVGPTNGIDPYDSDFMLTVSESPIDGTPKAYIAWITDISIGDEISACFYGYDNTQGSAPSLRIWGGWSSNNDINQYQGSAGGNEEYTEGTGWSQICHSWTAAEADDEALVIEARLYSSSSGPDPTVYFIDLVSVTAPESATVNYPGSSGPATNPVADAGENQTVTPGTEVTLDGTASYDPDGSILYWEWNQTGGVPVIINNDDSPSSFFTAPDDTFAALTFELTVWDEDFNEGNDEVYITVLGGDLTISIIQENFDAFDGQEVTITGVVTIGDGLLFPGTTKFYVQDDSGYGIQVYNSEELETVYLRGDYLEVTGTIDKYNDDVEITNPEITLLGTEYDLPEAHSLTNSEPLTMNGTWAALEGALTEYWNAVEDYGFTKLTITTGSGELDAMFWDSAVPGDELNQYEQMVGEELTIYGVITFYNGEPQLTCGYAEDIYLGILNINSNSFPEKFALLRNFPNPFNPETLISFQIPETAFGSLDIFDLSGKHVEHLTNGFYNAGQVYQLKWENKQISSGIYLLSLNYNQQIITQKLTLLK